MIITDMLKRGYAILIEVPDGQGGTTTARVKEFRPDTLEYIIGDLSPKASKEADKEPRKYGKRTTGGKRKVPATGARGVAVARTAGG